jgi:hypothetical protein
MPIFLTAYLFQKMSLTALSSDLCLLALKPGGYVWLKEALVSPDYQNRYEIAFPLLQQDHSFYVFDDPKLSKSITTTNSIASALNSGNPYRVVHHFTQEEFDEYFKGFDKKFTDITTSVSPNTGMSINTLTAIYQLSQ